MTAMCGGAGRGIGLAILLAFGSVSPAHAQFGDDDDGGVLVNLPGPEWYRANAAVDAKLEKGDLIQIARAMAKAAPTLDPEQLLERLNLFIRTGDRIQAERVIQAMAHTSLARDTTQPGQAADFLIAHGEWEPARHLMDVCPLATPSSKEFFVAHWEADSRSFPDMDRWLAYRERLNTAFWSPLYLEHRKRVGTLRPLLDERAAEVRAHPQDIARIEAYIAVANAFNRPPNLSWLPAACHLRLAVENLKIGLKLDGHFEDIAIPFLERALQLPITFDDYIWMEMQNGATPADSSNEPTPEAIHLYVKSVLRDRYQATNQPGKAKTLQDEIVKAAPNERAWYHSAFEAPNEVGNVAHGVEELRPITEVEDKSDYHYWLGRADGYLDQKAREKAEQAYQRALEVTRANPGDYDQARIAVMHRYFEFLYDPKHPTPVLKWLRSELEKTPLGGEYSGEVLAALFAVAPANSPDSRLLKETVWRYLALHRSWGSVEWSLLRKMVETVQGADREAVWSRAVKIAEGDPNREVSLGYVMRQVGETARAAPLFQAVGQQRKRNADRRAAVLVELKDALAKNDWPRAKAIWPEYRIGLNRNELSYWAQTLLDFAVRSGALDDAMELYRDWTHYDHNICQETNNDNPKIRFVERLANLGLREHLVKYYRDMAVADPDSHIPQDILPALLHPSVTVPQRGPGFGGRPDGSPPQPAIPFNLHASDPISLDLKDLDLPSALESLCDQAKISYVFALEGCKAHKVTLTLKEIPLEQAIARVLAAADPTPPLRSLLQQGVLRVSALPEPQRTDAPNYDLHAERLKSHVSAHFRDLDLSLSLKALLYVVGINFGFHDDDMRQITPTLSITATDVSAQDLLDRLMKTSHVPLSHWVEHGAYWIGRRDDAPK